MEVENYGGYVAPPTHLKRIAGKSGGGPLPPELRIIPDYDYRLFRYSALALPFLILLLATSVLLIGLTFWQGRWGFRRGPNGLENAVPLDYAIADADREGVGLDYEVRNLRIAMFVLGAVAVIIVGFTVRSRLTPGPRKALLLFAALICLGLGVISWVAFGMAIDDVQSAWECSWWTFPTFNYGPSDICDDRRQLSTATLVMDACLGTFALLLCFALVFTTTKKRWAWGPGRVSVEKSANKPAINYPPPSPFTHVAETRRVYVYILLFLVAAFTLMDWILTIMLHEVRVEPQQVDGLNHIVRRSGWSTFNNRFRLAISVFVFGIVVLNILDLLATKRRWIAYLLGWFIFLLSMAMFVVFAHDVDEVNDAGDLPCPEGPWVKPGYGTTPAVSFRVACVRWAYFATCFVDFMLALFLLLFALVEYFWRSTRKWSTYYFYADSEWLRNHSIFVDATDREAYDWKKYTMETGRPYYYSPTLGISTRVMPKNYVDPDIIAPIVM